MDNSTNTITIILAGVTIFSAVVNLFTVTKMFAKLADTIGRVLEQVLVKNNEKEVKEVDNE